MKGESLSTARNPGEAPPGKRRLRSARRTGFGPDRVQGGGYRLSRPRTAGQRAGRAAEPAPAAHRAGAGTAVASEFQLRAAITAALQATTCVSLSCDQTAEPYAP